MSNSDDKVIRVCLIEDDAGIIRAVEDTFAENDWLALTVEHIQSAKDTEAVPDKIENGQYHVLIVDLGLPTNKKVEHAWDVGFSLLEKLAGKGVDAVPIILTAYSQDENQLRAARVGAYAPLIAKKGLETWDKLPLYVRLAHAYWEGEQERRNAQEKEMLVKVASQFPHDMRNYLFVLKGGFSEIKAGEKLDDEMLGLCLTALEQCETLVSYFRDLMRGKPREPEITDQPWSGIFDSFKKFIPIFDQHMGYPANDLCIENSYQGNVTADKSLMERAVFNLAVNALRELGRRKKEGLQKKGELHITSHRDADGKRLVIQIEDNAGGLTPEQVADSGGLGIGISREIMRRHGGTFDFEKNEIGGTTFTMTLPLRQT